ncbi:MAG TPA: N-glycosylase/DNA lyase, partial [Chromatiaceae bacterium]|nr:N-glycosylase/DNA lyase [Chromatiaceae bacterium]
MFYYTLKARGVELEIPFTIPILVDRRVAMMTYLSGIV